MYCSKCGSKVDSPHSFCPSCGSKLEISETPKKKLPSFLKWFIYLLLAGLAVSLFLLGTAKNPHDTIVKQLNDIKANELSKAYYDYTTPEFQKETSLTEFKDLLNLHPSFKQVKNIEIQNQEVESDKAKYEIRLNSENQGSFGAVYELIKDDGAWKINSINLKELSGSASDSELLVPIQKQLEAIKNKNFKDAYDNYATKDFKQATSYEDFVLFVEGNPLLSDYQKIEHEKTTRHDGASKVKVKLSGKEDSLPVEYTLTEESGSWKIRGIQILSDSHGLEKIESKAYDAKELEASIHQFMELIKKGDFEKAYQDTTASFKEATNFETFKSVISKYEVFTDNKDIDLNDLNVNNNLASYSGILTAVNKDQKQVQFDLLPEDGVWKIQQILIFKSADKEKTAGGFEFTKVVIGDKADSKGFIHEPKNSITNSQAPIYVNLYIDNAKKDDVIKLALINEAEKIASPFVEHKIDEDAAHYVAFFIFDTPQNGWIKGLYELHAVRPDGSKQIYSFEVQ